MKKRTLKPEELMIGDWVLVNGTPQKVSGILNGQIIAENVGDSPTIEPIPVTPDILSPVMEELHESNRPYWSIDDELFFRVYTFSRTQIMMYCSFFDMTHDRAVLGIFSVHRLQQALRLFCYPSVAEEIKP